MAEAFTSPDGWDDEVYREHYERASAAVERGQNASEEAYAAARARFEGFLVAHEGDENLDPSAIGRAWILKEQMAALDADQEPEEAAALGDRVVADVLGERDGQRVMKIAASDVELEKRRSSTYERADREARELRDGFGSGEVSIVLGPTGNPPGRPRFGTEDPARARELIEERAGGISLEKLKKREHRQLRARVVAELREERRATPGALASALGCTERTIQRLVREMSGNPG